MTSHAVVVSLSTLVLVAAVATDAPAADLISGGARIVDGDTLTVGDVKIRLEGIDAPETDQVCLDQHADEWKCGVEARDHLADHVASRPIDCTPKGADAYGRTLAVCRLAGEDLNAWTVHEGWALAFIRYSSAYVTEEGQAREAERGLWSGAFIAPWNWRHRNCKETEVLGANKVPRDALAKLCPKCTDGAPSPDCIIKGVNNKGECIYHPPNSSHYCQINMNKSGRRWFCSEEEAQAAGCRAPRR
jgi:endonuclease YncB( thermonuclease family)